jgi:hypothetical protein
MGNILPSFKKALIDDLLINVGSNTSTYYAFAANPVAYTSSAPSVNTAEYQTLFMNEWQLLFGKKLLKQNFSYLIKNNPWVSNTVYTMYDNTDVSMNEENNFYVISPPDYPGGNYNVFKCIDNANNVPSTVKPNIVQATTFQTSDGYKWRYMSSITYKQYVDIATSDYCPVYSNNITALYANLYSGVETVMILNSGSNYSAYDDGIIQSANDVVIQIENASSAQNGLFNNSAIYIYNTESTTSQLLKIDNYIANSTGKWVYVNASANVDNILTGSTKYKISPRVVFQTDGNTQPLAYSIIDPKANSISEIVILDPGSDINWANVSITAAVGSGANLYAIVPPPGGHGFDIASELNVQGLAVTFNFSNNEVSTIPDNVIYNKIGIIKDPYGYVNATSIEKGSMFNSNTFNDLLKATLVAPVTFTVGTQVIGNTSGARGTVAFTNSSVIHLTGDKRFQDGEFIISSDGAVTSQMFITSYGDLYSKNIRPLYVQNINNVNRNSTQTETFKLIIQV